MAADYQHLLTSMVIGSPGQLLSTRCQFNSAAVTASGCPRHVVPESRSARSSARATRMEQKLHAFENGIIVCTQAVEAHVIKYKPQPQPALC